MSYDSLRDRMCKELHDISVKETFCPCDLDDAQKLIASINGLDIMSGHSDAHHKPDTVAAPSARSADRPTHLTLDEAKKWTAKMQNADGTTGPHWTTDQTSAVMSQKGLALDKSDFFAAINMMYSDYCGVAKTYGIDNANFYADLAAAFLHDKDAVPGKIVKYWDTVAD